MKAPYLDHELSLLGRVGICLALDLDDFSTLESGCFLQVPYLFELETILQTFLKVLLGLFGFKEIFFPFS